MPRFFAYAEKGSNRKRNLKNSVARYIEFYHLYYLVYNRCCCAIWLTKVGREKKSRVERFLAVIVIGLMCVGGVLTVSANENAIYEDAGMVAHRMSYVIYDVNGNVREEGILPIREEEAIKARDYWGSRTLNSGETMGLYSQDTSFPYFLIAGARVQMKFGLNRNVIIASGIVSQSGEYLASYRGLTGGRAHSVIVQTTGDYHGYIRNDDSNAVTVNYASFSTDY